MQETGRPKESIMQELESRLKQDHTFESGRIIGSMCTPPHPFARDLYPQFLEKNVGDAGLFPAVIDIEKETIQMIGSLLSNTDAYGHVVTGGTEANITALWTAKKLSKKNGKEIVLSRLAHCSFDKAAAILGLKLVRVPLNRGFQADIGAVEEAITSNTIALVGVAGTTALGTVDPIIEMSEIAFERDLYLHVDSAFGGFVLPFLRYLRRDVPDFDFALRGVKSMTVDPHKMGLAPIPSGGILFRNQEIGKTVGLSIPYLSGGEIQQDTIVGTRSSASIIAVWALMKYLGIDGYTKIVERCMRLTMNLAHRIPRINGLNIPVEPTMNIVGLTSKAYDIREIARELRRKGWAISLFPEHIRIVIMPHVQESHLTLFLEDLENVTNKLAERKGRN